MRKWLRFVKEKPLYGAIVVIALAGAAFFAFGGDSTEEELLTVERGPFVQEVSVSGKVVPAEEVTLAFPETGRVTSIAVKVGNRVGAGQALASLASATLASELRAAEAALALKRAQSSNTNVTVEDVRREQDTLVASAYRKLLSTGLAAVPSSSDEEATAPVISGLYDGAEGTYTVRITRPFLHTEDYVVRTFGLESTGPTAIEKDEPTRLGTRGLYVSFSGDMEEYVDTSWYVTIPNTKSSSYLANYNAYQEAQRARERAISDAEAELRAGPGGSIADAEIRSAEADVARIRAAIAERTLRAPFSGVITAVEAKLGGIAGANEPAVSLISAGALQIESYVPEINIPLLQVRDKAKVTLDAYGEEVSFEATIVSLDPAETVRDGVSTYRAVLQFDENDARIKPGMTANVVVTTDEREDVISVPQGIVITRDGKKYVRVNVNDKVEEREVTTGAISSLGNIEILSGLSEGETVVLSVPR